MYIYLGQGLSLKSQLSTFAKKIVSKNCGVIYGLYFPSGKWYVGQSIHFWRNRFYSYKNNNVSKGQIKLQNALNFYDWNDISIVILKYDVEHQDLDDTERYFISKMNSFHNGYNSTEGGKTLRGESHPCFGKKKSEKTKRLIGNANKGDKNYNYGRKGKLCHNFGRKDDDVTRYKKGSAFRGKKLSIEHVRKKSEAQTGKKNHKSKKCIVDGTEYDSIADASRDTGIKESTIGYRMQSSNYNTYHYVK
jgi:group I intron endonuclease